MQGWTVDRRTLCRKYTGTDEPCDLDATVKWRSDDGGDCVWRNGCLFRRSSKFGRLEKGTTVRLSRVEYSGEAEMQLNVVIVWNSAERDPGDEEGH